MRVYFTPPSQRTAYGTAIRGTPARHSVTTTQHLHALFKSPQRDAIMMLPSMLCRCGR